MAGSSGRRALQAFLVLLGAVALGAGAMAVLLGAGLVREPGNFAADLDSEFRFFATWYVVVGAVVLNAARDVGSAGRTVRVVGAGFFIAGCARALSWLTVGEPHLEYKILMIVELLLPVVIVPWQNAVASEE